MTKVKAGITKTSKLEMFFEKTAEDGSGKKNVYVPIMEFSRAMNLETGNGDTEVNTESKDICNVKIRDEKGDLKETAIFTLDSTTIYKKIEKTSNNNDSDYEEIKIENPIIKDAQERLCVDLYGLQKALNMSINYNSKSKEIKIFPLDYLIAKAKKKIVNIGTLDENYTNKKALLDDIIILVSATDSKKGAVSYELSESEIKDPSKRILQFEYTDIKYISQNGLFMVKKENQVGIMDGVANKTVIELAYEDLSLIDAKNELYLVKQNGLYGVIDKNGNTMIHIQYPKIGVDVTEYAANGLKNGYILLDKLIPVQENEKWKFYRLNTLKNQDGTSYINCELIQNLECDNIGCMTKYTGATAKNLMVIPEYNLIVIGQNQHYGLMALDGSIPIPAVLKDLYIATNFGKTEYFMVGVQNGKELTWNIIEQLQKRGYTKK